jgi:subtilisin family serine protease
VGAVNREGFRTFYSDFGKDLDIVAPSCDIDPDAYYDTHVTYKYKDGIPTTDIRGIIGYRVGDYAPLFCGTSAATPLVASIVALIFSANYDLTLTEVREIIHTTADKVSPDDALYDENEFSVYYGYGRINALKAVERACEFGCDPPDSEADLERYTRDELPTPVDHNGKVTTMTDENSIIPPAVDGCSVLLLP